LGEDVLDTFMKGHGGFNHNRQTLRIVELLEERYPDFPGLNLTFEVREGIAKHSGSIAAAPEFSEYEPSRQPPLEAQLIDLVDEIAYNHHDIDDGLSSGLLETDALADAVPLFGDPLRKARFRWPQSDPRRVRTVALRGLINVLVTDLIETTASAIRAAGVTTLEDVRDAGHLLSGLSPGVRDQNRALKSYLKTHLYEHHRIERMKDKAGRVLHALCERYLENPKLLPDDARRRTEAEGVHRAIADYVAGMTDRYATEEYQRLFDPTLRV
jgi:dGTPase